MSAQPTRRTSMEVQQLALWKHQQNLEEIKQLKASNSIQTSTVVLSPSKPETLSKLSKLSARKQKNSSGEAPRTPGQNLPESQQFSAPDQVASNATNSTINSLLQNVTIAINNTTNSTSGPGFGSGSLQAPRSEADKSQLEALLQEKQHWLKTIHEDNGKLSSMLQVIIYLYPPIVNIDPAFYCFTAKM